MKLVGVLFLLVAFTCSTGVYAEAKSGVVFEEIRLRLLEKRLAVLKASSGVTATPVTAVIIVAPTTRRSSRTTTLSSTTPTPTTEGLVLPSAALIAAAAAQGITLANLLALTPDELAQLEAMFML